MSKLDKLKEKISFLKYWLSVAVATLLAIVAWIATKYKESDLLIMFIGLVACVGLAITIWLLAKNINSKIDKLEDL